MFICYVCVDVCVDVGCHSLYVTMTIQRQIPWICADTLRQTPGWVRSGGRAPVELTAEVHPRFSEKPTRGETLKPVGSRWSSAQLVSTGRSLQLWIPRETWSFDEVPGAAPIRCWIAVRNHDFLKAQEFTSPGSLVRLNKTAFWDCSISKHSKHFNAPWGLSNHFKCSPVPADFNVSLFHYRGHGADVARVLVGLQVLHAVTRSDTQWHAVWCALFQVALITQTIVPADDTGVFGHTKKTQTPMSSAKWKKQKNA